MIVELAELNCDGGGVMERLKPPVGNMTLGNGNEGAIATKNDCDVGDGLLLLST